MSSCRNRPVGTRSRAWAIACSSRSTPVTSYPISASIAACRPGGDGLDLVSSPLLGNRAEEGVEPAARVRVDHAVGSSRTDHHDRSPDRKRWWLPPIGASLAHVRVAERSRSGRIRSGTIRRWGPSTARPGRRTSCGCSAARQRDSARSASCSWVSATARSSVQGVGDLAVRPPLRDVEEDLLLPVGEPVDGFGRGLSAFGLGEGGEQAGSS